MFRGKGLKPVAFKGLQQSSSSTFTAPLHDAADDAVAHKGMTGGALARQQRQEVTQARGLIRHATRNAGPHRKPTLVRHTSTGKLDVLVDAGKLHGTRTVFFGNPKRFENLIKRVRVVLGLAAVVGGEGDEADAVHNAGVQSGA